MRIIARAALCLMVASGFVAPNCIAQARSIDETVSLAVNSHPQIKSKFSEYQAQDEQVNKVESSFLPKLSVGLGFGREKSNNSSTQSLAGNDWNDLSRRESSVNLNQMLFDGFKTHWQRESELETYDSIEFGLLHLAGEVAMKSIESHLSVAATNRIFNFNVVNLQAHQKIAENIGARVRSGKDDYAKINQINARLSLSLANVAAAKNNVMKANADYFRVVGLEAAKTLVFQDKLFKLPESRNVFVADAIQFNPLIISRQKQTQSALASAKASKNTDLPTLHLESGASWNKNLDGVEDKNNDLFVMLRMRYDLFNGGGDKAVKVQSRILNQRAEYELDDARRIIRRDAEHAWFAYKSSAKRVKFLEDYVELSQLTKTAYDKQFTIGQRSLIDLLDAENELLRAKLQLVDAQKDLYLSKYQILNLSGKLLDFMSVNLAGI